jgi:peptide/nickel transport system substrate-binding protein
MALNTRVKPLDDVRVRKAIDLAIDEEAMINALMGKYGRVPTSVMNPLIFGGKKYPPKKADLKKAKELLAQAGYPNGFASKLYTPQGRYPKDKEMATLISAQLEQIGIKAPVEVFEWATYTSKVNNRDYSMVILGWGNTTGHADVFLHPQFHSSQMKSTLNPANYNNPEVDSLLEKARKTTNPDIQREAYHKVLDILQEQAPVIPLCHPVQIFALRGNVKGFASVPTEVIVLDKVYLE